MLQAMDGTNVIPVAPRAVRLLLSPLPLAPLRFALQRLVENVARRRPALFARLGPQGEKVFLIDPTDLPFVFRLRPHVNRPSIEALRRHDSHQWDARIAGPLGALLGMVHGTLDGDALFFSRDIVIEGDTEAVLALRNALDDAEIDLLAEMAAASGPARGGVEHLARSLVPIASRVTGLTLSRPDRS